MEDHFVTDIWRNFWTEKRTEVTYISAYRPASNPAERVMSTLDDMLIEYVIQIPSLSLKRAVHFFKILYLHVGLIRCMTKIQRWFFKIRLICGRKINVTMVNFSREFNMRSGQLKSIFLHQRSIKRKPYLGCKIRANISQRNYYSIACN